MQSDLSALLDEMTSTIACSKRVASISTFSWSCATAAASGMRE